MIRIAAVGDVHVGLDSAGVLRPKWESLPAEADERAQCKQFVCSSSER